MSTVRAAKSLKRIGGPDRDRTDDLFHAILTAARNSLKAVKLIGTQKH
jgi:hypothetical protein